MFIASCVSVDITEKSLIPSSLNLTSGIYTNWQDPSEPSLLQLYQSLLVWKMLQSLNHLCGPFLDSLEYVHIFLVLGNPEPGTVLQVWHHQCWVKGKDHFPWTAGGALPNTAQDTISLLCHKGTLPACIQLGVHQDTQVLTEKLLSS